MHFRKQQFWSSKSDGKSYFVDRDIATYLGYLEPHKAIARHCKGGMKHIILTNGENQELLR